MLAKDGPHGAMMLTKTAQKIWALMSESASPHTRFIS
jgi:hypothetical protein